VRAERNEVNVNHHVSQYINIIEALRQEISELKDQVKQANESKVLAMSQQPVLVRETKEGLFEHHHLFAELLVEYQSTTLQLHTKGAELARLTLSLQVLAAVPGQEVAGFGEFHLSVQKESFFLKTLSVAVVIRARAEKNQSDH